MRTRNNKLSAVSVLVWLVDSPHFQHIYFLQMMEMELLAEQEYAE